MKKIKRRVTIIVVVCVIILVGAIIADRILGKSYLKELKYDEVIEKINNKESFVLLLSQTTCAHCMDFKPKLTEVANKYKLEIYYLETNLIDAEVLKEFKANYFSFDGTPTTVFVIEGDEKTAANRINGDVSKEKIIAKLKSNGFIK